VQAADFLDDAMTVQQLSHHAAQWLFAPPSADKYSDTQHSDQPLARGIPAALPEGRLQVLPFCQLPACLSGGQC
jgi:hypothetical protein